MQDKWFNVVVTIYNVGDKPVWVNPGKYMSPVCVLPGQIYENRGTSRVLRLSKQRPPRWKP